MLAALLASLLPLAPAAGEPASTAALTVVTWGGAYARSQREALFEPYAEATGTAITRIDYNGGLDGIKAQQAAGDVTWDVIDLTMADAERGCHQGVLIPVDADSLAAAPDGTPARADFMPGTLLRCAVGTTLWSTVYAYDVASFSGGGPRTIADFFDTGRFPGNRGLRRVPQGNLEWALMSIGVPAREVYSVLSKPQGVRKAFEVLGELRPHIVWWESGDEPARLLDSGEVSMTSAYNGRMFHAQVIRDQPIQIVWDGQIYDVNFLAVPRGAPHREEALSFIRFATRPQRLAHQARLIPYSPVRRSALPMVTTHLASGVPMERHMPTAPANFSRALRNDYEWWARNQERIDRLFRAWLDEGGPDQ